MDPAIQQFIASIVIMYVVVGAAAIWYRRSQAAQPQTQFQTQSTENERRR